MWFVFHASKMLRGKPDCRIMERNVPLRISLWFGTGTVNVDDSIFFCIMKWLPLWRICTNPRFSESRQRSCPEKTWSLSNYNLQLCNKYFRVMPCWNFCFRSTFQKQFQRLTKICTSLLNCLSLTSHIHLRTKSHISITLLVLWLL